MSASASAFIMKLLTVGEKKKPNAQSENGTKAKEEEEEELAGRLWW
jgi:hypothetical protein